MVKILISKMVRDIRSFAEVIFYLSLVIGGLALFALCCLPAVYMLMHPFMSWPVALGLGILTQIGIDLYKLANRKKS